MKITKELIKSFIQEELDASKRRRHPLQQDPPGQRWPAMIGIDAEPELDKEIMLPDGRRFKVPLLPGETTNSPEFKKRVNSMMYDLGHAPLTDVLDERMYKPEEEDIDAPRGDIVGFPPVNPDLIKPRESEGFHDFVLDAAVHLTPFTDTLQAPSLRTDFPGAHMRSRHDIAQGGQVMRDVNVKLPDGTQLPVPLMDGETTESPSFRDRIQSYIMMALDDPREEKEQRMHEKDPLDEVLSYVNERAVFPLPKKKDPEEEGRAAKMKFADRWSKFHKAKEPSELDQILGADSDQDLDPETLTWIDNLIKTPGGKEKLKQLTAEQTSEREGDPLDEVLSYVNEQDDHWPGFESMEALDDWVGKPTEPSDPDLVTKRINALKMKEMIDDLSTSFPRVSEALAARDYETLGEMAQGMYTHHQQGRMEGSPHMQRKALMALNRARNMDIAAQGIWDAIGGTQIHMDLQRKAREHSKRLQHWKK